MAALRDPRLELFAREFALALTRGVKRSEAARLAAENSGYPNPQGKSFAANARKRAQRRDVQARVAELQQPALERAQQTINATAEWATQKLATIANYDLGEDAVKVPDQIAAIRALMDMHGWKAAEKHIHTLRAANNMTDDELAHIAAGGGASAASAPVDP